MQYAAHVKRPSWIIDPRTSKYIAGWDMITTSALIFTALVTPLEVAFFPPASDPLSGLFIINRMVDAVFAADIVLHFCLMYQVKSPNEGTRWVQQPREIAYRYLSGWFTLDFVSVLVMVFDIMGLSYDSDDFSKLKLLRILRVLRLIKLVRLMRASRMFKRWETRLEINYGKVAVIKCIVLIVLASHWFACVWGLQAALSDTTLQTWEGEYGYCRAVPDATEDTPGVSCHAGTCWECDGTAKLYVASLYFSMMTITSIGYGDLAAHPRNSVEQGVAVVLMLFGAMAWGQVIATFCRIIANMDPESNDFSRRMDDLNRFMDKEMLPPDMRRRLREYFHQTRHLQVHTSNRALLQMLSPALQGEVVWAVNERWLRRVWFFESAERPFMVEVALSLMPMVFSPGEIATSGYLYVVHRGIALYGGKVLTMGKVWGEDMILRSSLLRRPWCARAMNYLEVYMIDREELLDIAHMFPATYEAIHKCAVRLAMRRQFILAAKVLVADNDGQHSRRSTFDSAFENATTVTISELKLQQQRIISSVGMSQQRRGLVRATTSDVSQHIASAAERAAGQAAQTCQEQVVRLSKSAVETAIATNEAAAPAPAPAASAPADSSAAAGPSSMREASHGRSVSFGAVSEAPAAAPAAQGDGDAQIDRRLHVVASILKEKGKGSAGRARARSLSIPGGGGSGSDGGGSKPSNGMTDEDRNKLHQVAHDVTALRALITGRGGDPVSPKRGPPTRSMSAGGGSQCSWPLPASVQEPGQGDSASELAELKQRVAELTALVRQQQVPTAPSTEEISALSSQMFEIKAQLATLLESR